MILKIFALRDQKTDAFLNPIAFQAVGQCLRFLKDELAKNGELIASHSEDFELFELADYDISTGVLTPHAPRSIVVLSDLKEQR